MTNLVETKLNSELLPGERLLWSGQPRQGAKLRPADFVVVPAMWLLGALFIYVGGAAWLSGQQLGQASLVLLAGALLLCGPLVRFGGEAHWRRRIYYGLTDQRVLIISGFGRQQQQARSLAALGQVRVAVEPEGHGTLFFGEPFNLLGFTPPYLPPASGLGAPAFDDIEQPRAVYEQLHAAQARLLAGR